MFQSIFAGVVHFVFEEPRIFLMLNSEISTLVSYPVGKSEMNQSHVARITSVIRISSLEAHCLTTFFSSHPLLEEVCKVSGLLGGLTRCRARRHHDSGLLVTFE